MSYYDPRNDWPNERQVAFVVGLILGWLTGIMVAAIFLGSVSR